MTRLCGCRPTCHAPRSFCQDRLGRNVGNEPRQARGKRKRKLNNPGWRHFQASRCRPSAPASQSTVSQSVVWLDPSARSTAPHRPAAGRAEETLPCCSCIQFHLCTQQQTSTAKQHRLLTFEFSLCLSRACLGKMSIFSIQSGRKVPCSHLPTLTALFGDAPVDRICDQRPVDFRG